MVLILALWGLWPATPVTTATSANAPARGDAGGARPLAPLAPVNLDALEVSRQEPGEAERNPFRFQPKASRLHGHGSRNR